MTQEPESDFLLWYNNPTTQLEIDIIQKTFPGMDRYELVILALQMNILTALSIYELTQLEIEEIEDEDHGEGWKPEGKGFEL